MSIALGSGGHSMEKISQIEAIWASWIVGRESELARWLAGRLCTR